jgi:hypothetical protein
MEFRTSIPPGVRLFILYNGRHLILLILGIGGVHVDCS